MITKDSPYGTLHDYLVQADERVVFRALPRQVADALALDFRPTLEVLVDAMFKGEARLHWEIVCPSCGGRGEQHDWLRHARHEMFCRKCQADFIVYLDSEAQVTFSPHPQLRTLSEAADDPETRVELRQEFEPTTVQELLTIQSFSDWARNEPLPDGEHLEVRRVTIWFSDLQGSTALYDRRGDPYAYHLVRQHFDLVSSAVNHAGGAVVKTIGDGVMSVFLSGSQALKAAFAIHESLEDFNRREKLSDARKLALKVGIHTGPAIVVSLNDRLDYFGTTVNVASRISDLAQGGETTLTEAILEEEETQALIADLAVEPFETHVRGLEWPVAGRRLRPH